MSDEEYITQMSANYIYMLDKQQEEIERLKIIEEKYKDSQLYIKDFKDEIERLNNIIKEVSEYHNNCIENLNLDKIDDNEKLAYKVAYEIHKRYLEILDKGERRC